jgi:hypothetical protein
MTNASAMVLLLILAVAGSGAEAATPAPVDPALVGTWKLAQPGFNMIWQVRADGSYRYFGVNARPFEHWGTMQASGGRWSSRWAGGVDGGSYTLTGNTWVETGKVGTGNWLRVWKPGDGGSQVQCPLIDIALVETLVGDAVKGRVGPTNCTLTSSGVGYTDGVTITIIDNAASRFANVRRDGIKEGHVVDVPNVGNAAFIDGDSIHILKGNRYAVVTAGLYPDDPNAVSDAVLTNLGRSVAARF